MIWSAVLRPQSPRLSSAEMTRRAGARPSRVGEKGDPVSSRRPDGPKHAVTTWVLDVLRSDDDHLDIDLTRLRHVLDRFADVPDTDLTRDLIVAASAKETGNTVDVPPAVISDLAAHDAGLIIDIWPPDVDS